MVTARLYIVLRRVRSAASCGAEDLGEESDENDAYGGHACANDANVNFDGGPKRHFELVPCRVLGLGKCDQGLQTHNTDNGDTAGTHQQTTLKQEI